MKINNRLGGFLSVFASLIGLIAHFILFLIWYKVGTNKEVIHTGCEVLLVYIHPIMADLGFLGGVLFAVSAYGFFNKKNWAFLISMIAFVLALLGSWFVNMPFMDAGLPPIYFPLFFSYLILYFIFTIAIGKISWGRTLLALFTCFTYIFCLMNGIASTHHIITDGYPIFVLVQRLHFIAMIGWAVVTVGILTKPVEWTRIVCLAAGVTELTVGIPLAIITTMQLRRFSMFTLAPVCCLIIIVMLVWPNFWQKIISHNEE